MDMTSYNASSFSNTGGGILVGEDKPGLLKDGLASKWVLMGVQQVSIVEERKMRNVQDCEICLFLFPDVSLAEEEICCDLIG